MRRFAEIGSTNTWLLERAREGAPEGLVAVAEHQTAGRGRRGRTWEAPPGANLLVSFLLRPRLPLERRHLVVAAVALAAREACIATGGEALAAVVGLKWPNDLLAGGQKLAGVLAEADGDAVVVGMGLNVGWAPPGATCLSALLTVDPAEARTGGAGGPEQATSTTAGGPGQAVSATAGGPGQATSTTAAGPGQAVSATPPGVLDALLPALAGRYGASDWASVAADYRRACVTLGTQVRVELVEETFTGVAADITDEGHLLVETAACLRTVTAGDVVHLR